VAGLMAPEVQPLPVEPEVFTWGGLQLALILVLFTFGGWNEMAYVAAEIKRPQQNIIRGLLLGTLTVTALYLLINWAFLSALGVKGMSTSQAVAVDVMGRVFPAIAERIIAIIICISALGAVNGLVFTGARISYALGSDHRSFRPLGKWNPRLGTPVWALIVQGGLSLAIVLVAGSFINTILYAAPVVWLFFLATALSLFVLRRKEPHIPRPYRVSVYPLVPLIFSLCCLFMLYSAAAFALGHRPVGLLVLLGVMLFGLIIYGVSHQKAE